MDEINREHAERAGITQDRIWQGIAKGMDEEEGTVRYNYHKLAGEWLGMKPAEKHEVKADLADSFRKVAAMLIKGDSGKAGEGEPK